MDLGNGIRTMDRESDIFWWIYLFFC